MIIWASKKDYTLVNIKLMSIDKSAYIVKGHLNRIIFCNWLLNPQNLETEWG